jgi:hypothetical protein
VEVIGKLAYVVPRGHANAVDHFEVRGNSLARCRLPPRRKQTSVQNARRELRSHASGVEYVEEAVAAYSLGVFESALDSA